MISCDWFEQNYGQWKDGRLGAEAVREMSAHSDSCPYCASHDRDVFKIRRLVSQAPTYNQPVGFELRLTKRLEEAEGAADSHSSRVRDRGSETGFIPRWAALGAGLATGVFVGLVFLIPGNRNENSQTVMTAESTVVTGVQQVTDSTNLAADTTLPADHSFDIDQHSRVVSDHR